MTAVDGAAFAGRTILVTGGAGFIGSHLVDALAGLGARVRVLDDLSTGRAENLASGPAVELIEGSITDRRLVETAVRGAALVFHQAALGSVPRSLAEPSATIEVNVAGTANVLTAARDAAVERVIYASSSSVYGDAAALPRREGEEGRALSPYALSKQMGEMLAAHFDRDLGLATIGLRYFNVYGPRQRPDGPYAAVVPRFFGAVRAGTAPVIYGDGEQSRDFTFVDDAVRANLLAAVAGDGARGKAFNVGAGQRTTVQELAEAVRRAAGGPEPVHEPPRAGDVRHAVAALDAVAETLGFRPRVVLEEGLARTAAAFAGGQPPAP